MTDDFDEVDVAEVARVQGPRANIPPSTYDAFNDRIEVQGRGIANQTVRFTDSQKNASLFRRRLLTYMVVDNRDRLYMDESMTYAYFQKKNSSESVLALKARLVRWTAPSQVPAVPRIGSAAGIEWAVGRGPIEEARASHAKDSMREARAGGSYELLVGQLVKDYESSFRSLVEQDLKGLALDVDDLYSFYRRYPSAEESFVSQSFDNAVASIQQDFSTIQRTIEEDLMEMLVKINRIVSNVYSMRDLRKKAKKLFDGDSFNDQYLAQVFVETSTDNFCFFSTSDGERRGIQIYDEKNEVQLESNQRLRLEGLSGSLAHCLAHDLPMARKKLQMERAQGKELTIPAFLNFCRKQPQSS